jgi:hypothetical protein
VDGRFATGGTGMQAARTGDTVSVQDLTFDLQLVDIG